jgi:mannose-6-phosphate isomerase-like protein (cupin superfamily)
VERPRVSLESGTLESGTLLRIEAGERHAISNAGRVPRVTVNVCAPPEY